MKNFFQILLAILILTSNAFSIKTNFNNQNSNIKNVAYTITLQSRVINGNFIPERKMDIELLPDNNVFQNVVEIKTKNYKNEISQDKYFQNDKLQSAFTGLNITRIEKPYAQIIEGDKLLNNDKYGLGKVCQIYFNDNLNPYEVCKILMQNPEIEYAVPVFKRYLHDITPNDPNYSQQYHLAKISMPQAWEISKGSETVTIAIVDTGTDIEHNDLKNNIWTNPKEIPNNGKDDDNNGKIDDIHGWDFIGATTSQEIQNGIYKEDNDPNNDLNTHGTHTAGCAAATTNNNIGVASPAGFYCKILPVKCTSDAISQAGVIRGYEGILYAAKCGADIINCSWGGPGWSPTEEDIINQATDLGSLVVASAGNSATNLDIDKQYPAAFKRVLSVGSTGSSDKASSFTCYGNSVRIFAPGDNILSTLPNNQYGAESGTSMSSPVAAGVAALIKSIHKQWTPDKIMYQLRSTCDNAIAASNAALRPYFFGRINALNAIKYNNDNPDFRIPGIGLFSFEVGGKGSITNKSSNEFKVSVKNFLAQSNDIKIKLTPIDNFIELDETNFEIGTISEDETKLITTNISLNDNNPWFKGYADIMMEITGTNYINYEMVQIPIELPTTNTFTQLSNVSSSYQITWHSSTVLDNDLLYVVGESPYIGGFALRTNGTSTNLLNISNQAVYCMYAFDANKLLVGDGPTGGLANIHTSTDGGTTWSKQGVGTITPFVNSINFFSATDGIILGDPKNAEWGIGKTTDAGATWNKITGVPAPIGNETGLVGSIHQINDTIWFGTTNGRVLKSTDKGVTWKASTVLTGGSVSNLSFNENIGLCVYAVSSAQNADRALAVSTDGGATWATNVYNFTKNSVAPVSIYAIKESNTFVIQLSNGMVWASDNQGKSFYPILTTQTTGYTESIATQTGNTVSLYSAGEVISKLIFNFTPAAIKKVVKVTSGTFIKFDSVEINKNAEKTIDLKNDGNTDINVSSMKFVPDDGTDVNDFKILFNYPKLLEPGASYQVRFRFQPKTVGQKTGQFVIESDAQNPEVKIDIVGIAINTTSVEELIDNNIITLSPNPTSNTLMITTDKTLQINDAFIIDSDGKIIKLLNNSDLDKVCDISSLPIGSYHLQLMTDKGNFSKQFIIIR